MELNLNQEPHDHKGINPCPVCSERQARIALKQVVAMFENATYEKTKGRLAAYERVIEQLRQEAEK